MSQFLDAHRARADASCMRTNSHLNFTPAVPLSATPPYRRASLPSRSAAPRSERLARRSAGTCRSSARHRPASGAAQGSPSSSVRRNRKPATGTDHVLGLWGVQPTSGSSILGYESCPPSLVDSLDQPQIFSTNFKVLGRPFGSPLHGGSRLRLR